jgi:thiosulfate/3-mercaptopyruvate sulfurtransferase
MADPRSEVFVSVDELAADVAGNRSPVLLDVRWALAAAGQTFDGLSRYRAGHIPGAVFVSLDAELAAPPAPVLGRHPLPDSAAFQAAARRWGIRQDSRVVAYDGTGAMAAARAWWLLRYSGVSDVRLLDGGLPAWERAGLPVESGDVAPPPGDVVLTPGHLPVLDADGAARLARDGLLLDARAGERFRGEVEPIDPKAGHIPGAVSAPTSDNLEPDGTFRSAGELRSRFTALGVVAEADRVGVYCGSGVTAAHEAAVLASLGIEAALYPGSWSQWSHDDARPVATGP